MSDERDWNFVNADEAKTEIRAAVEYLLRGATGGARGDIVQEIIAIVHERITIEPARPLGRWLARQLAWRKDALSRA